MSKDLLNRFWESIKVSDKLALLQKYADITIEDTSEENLKAKRECFDKLEKRSLGDKCFVCSKPSEVRHHIILLKNGGENEGDNLVPLCNYCHGKIHKWLMFSERPKIVKLPPRKRGKSETDRRYRVTKFRYMTTKEANMHRVKAKAKAFKKKKLFLHKLERLEKLKVEGLC